ncbi:sodium-coupled monocarboxylate transporter 2-like isoform X3 [Periplaneta americana]|uniref:sodium-coupled monocarboxylate transporter 2-like isoform X3 n=1 Tax=Periplaneta americana TaxID=6978 RepID=UPI0037E94D62
MENATCGMGLHKQPLLFGWFDFTVFGAMLVASALVGVYFGIYKKQDTKVAYLLGGKSMSTVPVAVSLVACHISGVTVLGVPSEIYVYGTLYLLVCFSCIFVAVVTNYVYLPVFFELQLTSTYEYLEMRFSRGVRVMASVLYTISMLLYMPIVVYVPALAFSQVSDVKLHLITPAVCIICIFYTMLGGLKAVVWSDLIQAVVMVGSCLTVVFIGVHQVGGWQTVIEQSTAGGRINMLELDPSPLARNTLWTVLIGTTLLRLGNMVNQASVQKFISLPKKSNISKVLVMYCIGIITMKLLSGVAGLLIYTTYHDCDPIKSGAVKRADQLLAYYVMDVAGSIPGLPGLFVAGVFSASLSSMSSCLNCLAATIYEDFVRPNLKGDESEQRAGWIMKTIVLVVGAISVLLVFVVEQLGGVLEISYSAQGITCGALLGLFSLGIFFPWANAKGALWGSIASLGIVSIIVFGAQRALATGKITHKTLPTSILGCLANTTLNNSTVTELLDQEQDEAFVLFRISYWYYGVVGSFTVIIVGMLISAITGLQNPRKLNIVLIAPFLRNYVTRGSEAEEEVVELTEKDLLTMTQEQNSYGPSRDSVE